MGSTIEWNKREINDDDSLFASLNLNPFQARLCLRVGISIATFNVFKGGNKLLKVAYFVVGFNYYAVQAPTLI